MAPPARFALQCAVPQCLITLDRSGGSIGLSPACGVRGGAQRPVTSQGPGARRRAGLGGGAGADRGPRLLHQLRAPGPGRRAAMCTGQPTKAAHGRLSSAQGA